MAKTKKKESTQKKVTAFKNFLKGSIWKEFKPLKTPQIKKIFIEAEIEEEFRTKTEHLKFIEKLSNTNITKFIKSLKLTKFCKALHAQLDTLASTLENTNTTQIRKELKELPSLVKFQEVKSYFKQYSLTWLSKEKEFPKYITAVLKILTKEERVLLYGFFIEVFKELKENKELWKDLDENLVKYLVYKKYVKGLNYKNPTISDKKDIITAFENQIGKLALMNLIETAKKYPIKTVEKQLSNICASFKINRYYPFLRPWGKISKQSRAKASKFILNDTRPIEKQVFYAETLSSFFIDFMPIVHGVARSSRFKYRSVKRTGKQVTLKMSATIVSNNNRRNYDDYYDYWDGDEYGPSSTTYNVHATYDPAKKKGNQISGSCDCFYGKRGFCAHVFVAGEHLVKSGIAPETAWNPIPVPQDYIKTRSTWKKIKQLDKYSPEITKKVKSREKLDKKLEIDDLATTFLLKLDKNGLSEEQYSVLSILKTLQEAKLIAKSGYINLEKIDLSWKQLKISTNVNDFIIKLGNMGFLKKFTPTRATLIDAIKTEKIQLYHCSESGCEKAYQSISGGVQCVHCGLYYCKEHSLEFTQSEDGLCCPSCSKKFEELSVRETPSEWYQDPQGEIVPIEELIQGKEKILPRDGVISNSYLEFNDVVKKFDVRTRYYDVKYFINLYSENGEAFQNVSTDIVPQTVGNPLRVSDPAVRSLFEILQYNRLGRFSHLYIWVLESITHSSALGDLQYLKILLNPPGEQLKLPKSTPLVQVCEHCDTMPLRYDVDDIVVHDELRNSTCPYCGKPKKLVLRARKPIRIELDTSAPPPKLAVRSDIFLLGVLYKLTPVKIKLSAQSMEHFWQNYQNLFDNQRIGPFSVQLRGNSNSSSSSRSSRSSRSSQSYYNPYSSRSSYQPQRSIYASSVIESIGPIHLENIEWRSVELFPEDMIIF